MGGFRAKRAALVDSRGCPGGVGEFDDPVGGAADPAPCAIANRRAHPAPRAGCPLVFDRAGRQRFAAVRAAGFPRTAALAVAAQIRAGAALANLCVPDAAAFDAALVPPAAAVAGGAVGQARAYPVRLTALGHFARPAFHAEEAFAALPRPRAADLGRRPVRRAASSAFSPFAIVIQGAAAAVDARKRYATRLAARVQAGAVAAEVGRAVDRFLKDAGARAVADRGDQRGSRAHDREALRPRRRDDAVGRATIASAAAGRAVGGASGSAVNRLAHDGKALAGRIARLALPGAGAVAANAVGAVARRTFGDGRTRLAVRLEAAAVRADAARADDAAGSAVVRIPRRLRATPVAGRRRGETGAPAASRCVLDAARTIDALTGLPADFPRLAPHRGGPRTGLQANRRRQCSQHAPQHNAARCTGGEYTRHLVEPRLIHRCTRPRPLAHARWLDRSRDRRSKHGHGKPLSSGLPSRS
jgi:hypothetical protein